MPTAEDKSQSNSDDLGKKKFVCVKAGASLVKRKLCFSNDSKFLFVAVDTSVRVYSTSTSECVNVFNNNKGEIILHFLNPRNYLQLITVTHTGTVCYWDYIDAILIREVSLNLNIKQCFPYTEANSFFVIASSLDENIKHQNLLQIVIDFETLKFSRKKLDKLPKYKKKQVISLSHNFNFIAIIDKNSLKVSDVTQETQRRHGVKEPVKFTCLQWHPTDECIATGLSTGRVLLWYNYFDKNPIRSSFHWHSLPVMDVEFSTSGNFIFSGGNESVLLKWNITSGQRGLLPRVGMPICKITCSPDSNIVAMSHIDNSITMLNQNFTPIGIVQGLTRINQWDEILDNPVPTGLMFDKHLSALVLNGKPGHLQFYNIREDKQIFNLDIVEENYIHRERNIKLYHLDVIKAAFSTNGDWLATVEYRNDHQTNPEIRLKFWKYLEANQNFSLNTTIDMPHEEIVNCLAIQPCKNNSKPLAVTTSGDKSFRIWSLTTDKVETWNCQSVGFYRNEKAGDACFAEDGSVLAVVFNCYITLWFPEENALKSTLYSVSSSEEIKKIEFGRGDCSHILVCHTSNVLTAWNTLALNELWCVYLECACLVSDPASSVMAAFGMDDNIFMFKPSNPNPIGIYKRDNDEKVITASFFGRNETNCGGSGEDHSDLYFMTSGQYLYTLTSEEPSSDQPVKVQKAFGQHNTSLTPFGLLLAEKHKSGVQNLETKLQELHINKGKKIVDMVLNTPSHVLPSSSELFDAYLNLLMKAKEKKMRKEMEKSMANENQEYISKESSAKLIKKVDEKKSDVMEVEPATEEEILERLSKDDFTWVNKLFTD